MHDLGMFELHNVVDVLPRRPIATRKVELAVTGKLIGRQNDRPHPEGFRRRRAILNVLPSVKAHVQSEGFAVLDA
jgi:hypothetical protein